MSKLTLWPTHSLTKTLKLEKDWHSYWRGNAKSSATLEAMQFFLFKPSESNPSFTLPVCLQQLPDGQSDKVSYGKFSSATTPNMTWLFPGVCRLTSWTLLAQELLRKCSPETQQDKGDNVAQQWPTSQCNPPNCGSAEHFRIQEHSHQTMMIWGA